MKMPRDTVYLLCGVLAFVAALASPVQGRDLNDLDLQDIQFDDIFSLLPSKSFNANKDIDKVLKLLSRIVPNTAKVPDIGTEMNLQECFAEGLSSGIQRAGDVALNLTETRVSFSFGLGISDVGVKCSWKRKVLTALTLVGTARADVDKIGVSAVISINLQPGNHPVLNDFSVHHLNNIQTTFTGLGFLNRLASRLSEIIIKSSRERLVNELEEDVAQKLQKALTKLKVPRL